MGNDRHIAWVFDDPQNYYNMTACPHTRLSQDRVHLEGRFSKSNLFWYWYSALRYAKGIDVSHSIHSIDDRPSRYAYGIGTNLEPSYWAGFPDNPHGFGDLFTLIPSEVKSDARQGSAMIVIDSLNEGFHDPLLFGFLHSCCEQNGIPPSSIIYATSNLAEETAYNRWAEQNALRDRIEVISFCHWQYQYILLAKSSPSISWTDHEKHKKKSNAQLKLYTCLNRFPKPFREYLVLRLIQSGLDYDGAISHGPLIFPDWLDTDITQETLERAATMLPLIVDDADYLTNQKAIHFNPNLYLDSWISVVTETLAMDDVDNLYLSEKIFKPINALQPFMVLGHAGTLEKLHELGYRTFHGLIDESYDKGSFFQRVDGIIKNLWMLKVLRDKWGWLEDCRETCIYNRTVFMSHDFFDSAAVNRILAAYRRLET